MRGAVYVNGTIAPADQATIPVYDHGFVYGEGVHSGKHGTAIFPDAMRWMWRDYPRD